MSLKQSYTIRNSTLTIKVGDISEAKTDVIVTSDDTQLSMGGGTSAAIRRAAGESVYVSSRSYIPRPLGTVISTPAGDLAKQGVCHIFHAATIASGSGPAVEDQNKIIRDVTQQSIELLQAMKHKSIAFPALGTGFANFDSQTVAIAMAETIRELLSASSASLQVEIWLLLSPKKGLDILQFFAEFTTRAKLGPCAVRKHTVVLIHGIMTPAGWFNRVRDEIEHADPRIAAAPTGYGLFGVIRFLIPISALRRQAAETVWNKMKFLFTDPNTDHVSVIAHSFGTWIVGYIISNKKIRFHRVILCGSVLDIHFPWVDVAQKIDPIFNDSRELVVNDCGTMDIWPIFAKTMTWGYGHAGRWGFQNPLVRDRFHKKKHSGFFEGGFATKYWVSALNGTAIMEGTVEEKTEPPMWLSILTVIKLPLVLIGAGLIWFWYRM